MRTWLCLIGLLLGSIGGNAIGRFRRRFRLRPLLKGWISRCGFHALHIRGMLWSVSR
jgi:hypothetical protein